MDSCQQWGSRHWKTSYIESSWDIEQARSSAKRGSLHQRKLSQGWFRRVTLLQSRVRNETTAFMAVTEIGLYYTCFQGELEKNSYQNQNPLFLIPHIYRIWPRDLMPKISFGFHNARGNVTPVKHVESWVKSDKQWERHIRSLINRRIDVQEHRYLTGSSKTTVQS